MVKTLSCVSCGSLKRFPHTFTNARYLLIDKKSNGQNDEQLFWDHFFEDSTMKITLLDFFFKKKLATYKFPFTCINIG